MRVEGVLDTYLKVFEQGEFWQKVGSLLEDFDVRVERVGFDGREVEFVVSGLLDRGAFGPAIEEALQWFINLRGARGRTL